MLQNNVKDATYSCYARTRGKTHQFPSLQTGWPLSGSCTVSARTTGVALTVMTAKNRDERMADESMMYCRRCRDAGIARWLCELKDADRRGRKEASRRLTATFTLHPMSLRSMFAHTGLLHLCLFESSKMFGFIGPFGDKALTSDRTAAGSAAAMLQKAEQGRCQLILVSSRSYQCELCTVFRYGFVRGFA